MPSPKALRRGLAAYGKVLHLTMRSAQSNGHEAKNENFGTSAVCIIEVHLGKKVPGKLSWLLGGHRVVMPVTLLPLDPPQTQTSCRVEACGRQIRYCSCSCSFICSCLFSSTCFCLRAKRRGREKLVKQSSWWALCGSLFGFSCRIFMPG